MSIDLVDDSADSKGTLVLLGLWIFATMTLWGFAFFHIPGATPEWLLRAQAACFGTSATGLPDTYGWTVLVLAPLSMLISMIVVFKSELTDSLRTILQIGIWQKFIFLLTILITLESIWVANRISQGLTVLNTSYESLNSDRLPAEYAKTSKNTPDFTLIDQSGNNVSLSSFKGKSVLVSFFFAHCRTVCPVLVKTLQTASKELDNKVPILMISLDPWRDTPKSLPSLAKSWGFGINQYALSGSTDSVTKVIQDFEVPTDRSDKNGDIVHPALVYVIDPKGNIAYSFNNPSVQWIVDGINRLEDSQG